MKRPMPRYVYTPVTRLSLEPSVIGPTLISWVVVLGHEVWILVQTLRALRV